MVHADLEILFGTQPPVRVTAGADLGLLWTEPGFFPAGPPTCCSADPDQVFLRVDAAYLAAGGTRVTWQFVPSFGDAGPFTATLQWSASGQPTADDWADCGAGARDPAFLVDPEPRLFGNWEFLRYRVLLASDGGGVYTSLPVPPGAVLPEPDRLWAVELARKERLRLSATAAGVYGYLLQERRYGTLCSCVDPTTREQANSSCPNCYGRQYVGGYHAAAPCWSADLTPQERTKVVDHAGGRGTVTDATRFARVLAELPVGTNDLWVSHYSDERYRVEVVKELATVRGVAVVYGLRLWKLPRTDVAYRIPVARIDPPVPVCPPPPAPVRVCF